MKKVLKEAEPSLLKAYRVNNPSNTWEHCKKSDARKKEIHAQLKSDQAGLCAYCEIRLVDKDTTGEADFRVEHFHPKSDTSTTHNWHLDWNNLLGCCHGGSRRDVADADKRFTSPDNSCDVPKGDRDLDTVILNPLTLPAFPVLFHTERSTGLIRVNYKNCRTANACETKARQTIDELRLDAVRLNRFRKAVLDNVNGSLQTMMANGQTIDQARTRLAKVLLSKDSNHNWPAFFPVSVATSGKKRNNI